VAPALEVNALAADKPPDDKTPTVDPANWGTTLLITVATPTAPYTLTVHELLAWAKFSNWPTT
jgi:hypothetical protein